MSHNPRLEITSKKDWRLVHELKSPIVRIGSHKDNDIQLEASQGVADWHAQIILIRKEDDGSHGPAYRLTNVSDEDFKLLTSGEKLAPRESKKLDDGLVFQLGDFKLEFSKGRATQQSDHIQLSLLSGRIQLAPGRRLDPVVKVRNLGEESGAQFRLDVDAGGFDADCYGLMPGPVLASGQERGVRFWLHHRYTRPLAGEYPFVLWATATDIYPDEEVSITVVVQVEPYYDYELTIVPPGEDALLPSHNPGR